MMKECFDKMIGQIILFSIIIGAAIIGIAIGLVYLIKWLL